jgi:hypothetical protein
MVWCNNCNAENKTARLRLPNERSLLGEFKHLCDDCARKENYTG